jgi:hypothetical protein
MMTKTYATRTFSDIYPDEYTFISDLNEAINFTMSDEEKSDLFWMIYSKYGDSNVRYTNEYLFKAALFKRYVNVYYPTLLAILREQKKLRETPDDEFAKAGKMVVNIGAHNTADVSTDTTEGIEQLDTQQISNSQRGLMSVIADRLSVLKAGMEEQFLKRLNPLFIQIIAPQWDLLYGHDPKDFEEG